MNGKVLQSIKTFFHRIIGTQQIKYIQINTYCNSLLSKIMPSYYLPRTYMSMDAYGLAYILNEIIINNRSNIIEFGSGISTILMAKIAKTNNLRLQIISIDENPGWIETLKRILVKEGLDNLVRLINAPVIKSNTDPDNYWYDEKIIRQICEGEKFDMVIVDGPKVSDHKKELIRSQAMYFLIKNLAEDYFVYLDDANRKGERKILNRWSNELNINFQVRNQSAIAYHGKYFSADPIL